jgi:hypothetical protein
MDTTQPSIQFTTSAITLANRWDHFLARWGYKRSEHRIRPGLYALGKPTAESPVFVTANYTLSFDAVRSALAGMDGYILVLDTEGINVWCAAGKGTFGTDELVHRIEVTGLRDVVGHRTLILPQLGAAGVAAYEVKKRSGFKVEYGPVRAADLPEYLKTRTATPEMRRVRFNLADRLALIPVELVHTVVPTLIASVVAFLIGGFFAMAAVVMAIMAGVVLFPILLPSIPTADFSSKGFILGTIVAFPFSLLSFQGNPQVTWWLQATRAFGYLLLLPPITAFLALNFTGSTPFTSRSGVRREIFTYIPIMAWTFGMGILVLVAVSLIRILGG